MAAALASAAPSLVLAQSEASHSASEGVGGYYGMGPGMMGDYGGGWGNGMGPGVMGDYAMGPGMMGGYGWGRDLGLTDEQQAKINRIHDETRRTHWALMGAMMDQQAKLRDLYSAPKHDDAAINDAYTAMTKLQRQMYESSIEARKRIDAVLTKEQQDKLRSYSRNGGSGG